MGKQINLALIQMTCGENLEQNYDKALAYIRVAAGQGADIVCTQELFKSRYFCQVEDSDYFGFAESIDEQGPTMRSLSELAAELGIVLVASLFEKRASGLYHNTAVVIDVGLRMSLEVQVDSVPCDKIIPSAAAETLGDFNIGHLVRRGVLRIPVRIRARIVSAPDILGICA